MKKKILTPALMTLFAFTVVTVITTSVQGLGGQAEAKKGCGPDACPDVWNPVICSDGRIYSNMCYARRACATGCVYY